MLPRQASRFSRLIYHHDAKKCKRKRKNGKRKRKVSGVTLATTGVTPERVPQAYRHKQVPGMDATVPGALENAIRSLRRTGLEVIFSPTLGKLAVALLEVGGEHVNVFNDQPLTI